MPVPTSTKSINPLRAWFHTRRFEIVQSLVEKYYKKGDVVSVRGESVKLISIGRKIFARNMKTGKKMKIRGRDLYN